MYSLSTSFRRERQKEETTTFGMGKDELYRSACKRIPSNGIFQQICKYKKKNIDNIQIKRNKNVLGGSPRRY